MQLYRGMDIGTAKLPIGERRGIPHHLLRRARRHRRSRGRLVSGCRAHRDRRHPRSRRRRDPRRRLGAVRLERDLRLPLPAARRRAARASSRPSSTTHGPGVLFARLREADPATAARIDPKNGRRIVRALEVLAQGAATHGAALPEAPVLWRDAHAHHRRRRARATSSSRASTRGSSACGRDGLLDEVAGLRARGLEDGVTARRAIGYAQALAQLRGRRRPRPRRSPRRRRSRAATRDGRSRGSSATPRSTWVEPERMPRPWQTRSGDCRHPRLRPRRHRGGRGALARGRAHAAVERSAPGHRAQALGAARALPRRAWMATMSSGR